MKKTMTILMAVLGLTISAHAGGSAQYNPYTDGWTYCDQYGQSTGSSQYNPYTAVTSSATSTVSRPARPPGTLTLRAGSSTISTASKQLANRL